MDKRIHNCFSCGEVLPNSDVVALNRKLYGESVEKFFCLPCLAETIGVTTEELLAKIEEFKAEGCKLFG